MVTGKYQLKALCQEALMIYYTPSLRQGALYTLLMHLTIKTTRVTIPRFNFTV